MKVVVFVVLMLSLVGKFGRSVVVIDRETSEPLVGVRVECDSVVSYTDFDGRARVCDDSLVLRYVSYEENVGLVRDTVAMSRAE